MVGEHPLGERRLGLALDLDVEQHPGRLAVLGVDLDELVRVAPPRLGLPDDLLELLIAEGEPPRPVDPGVELGQEQGHPLLQVVLERLLPRRVVVAATACRLRCLRHA